MLRRRPDLGVLREQAAEVGSQLDTIRTAELSLFPYLATHHSFREIGEELRLLPPVEAFLESLASPRTHGACEGCSCSAGREPSKRTTSTTG